MPFVKISCLPTTEFKDSDVMEAMEDAFAEKTDLAIGTASFLWQTLDCMAHRKKGETAYHSIRAFDPSLEEFPIFVDLYITSVLIIARSIQLWKQLQLLLLKQQMFQRVTFLSIVILLSQDMYTFLVEPGLQMI